MIVFVTEKPSVAREYEKVLDVSKKNENQVGCIEGFSKELDKKVIITWAVGHLVSLGCVEEQIEQRKMSTAQLKANKKKWSKDALPILPDNWIYTVNGATKDQFEIIKNIYMRDDIDTIYYAGDSGREGIYIQALIRNQIFKKPPKCKEKVVWIDSFTKEAILKGIKEAKPYNEYLPMVESGYARAISDWLIGMNLTQAFTLTSGALIKVGRVMTPTLAMIVNRQKEIDDFKITDYYGISAKISTGYAPKWKDKEKKYEDITYNDSGFLKEKDAISLMNSLDKKLIVNDVNISKKKEVAPLLFNLADLQATCSKSFNISPAKTLQIAQELYEEKLITYPRTDSRYLTSAVAKEIGSVPKKYVDDSKVTDHYALIPTHYRNAKLDELGDLKGDVYNIIVKRFLSIFMSPYEYENITIEYFSFNSKLPILSESEHTKQNKEYFYATIKRVTSCGWRELYGEEITLNDFIEIPTKGAEYSATYFINNMKTQPPSLYTTGSLILAMEKAGKLIEDETLKEQIKSSGIGTSATRANIIEKLKKSGYIETDKKQKITPTEMGKKIIEVVGNYDTSLVSPEKTAQMERELSDIVCNKITYKEYNEQIKNYIKESVSTVLKSNTALVTELRSEHTLVISKDTDIGICPKCGSPIKKGKYGNYCTNKCGMSFKIYGKDLTDAQIKTLLSNKSVKIKSGKFENTVYPKIVENKYKGKIYYNFYSE